MALNIGITSDAVERVTCARIGVIGVGGAGGNAVNNMIESGIVGVDFIVANTDAQSLEVSLCHTRLQLGVETTKGLGAGANPLIGRMAAEESAQKIKEAISGFNMLFIAAGMGGGTGTGAAPVIAGIAKDMGILTVAVVTKPFDFEGLPRMKVALAGLEEIALNTDSTIIVPNQNLFAIADEKITFVNAFKIVDCVLAGGVRAIVDLVLRPGLINVDFADLCTVMRNMGPAMMGVGEASGENRGMQAVERVIANPLLDINSLKGAKNVLVNVSGTKSLELMEINDVLNRIRDEIDPEANIIFGSCFDDDMEDIIRIALIATGVGNTGRHTDDKRHKGEAASHKPEEKVPASGHDAEPPAAAGFLDFVSIKAGKSMPRHIAVASDISDEHFIVAHAVDPDASLEEMVSAAVQDDDDRPLPSVEFPSPGRFAVSPAPIAAKSAVGASKPRRKPVRSTLFAQVAAGQTQSTLQLNFDTAVKQNKPKEKPEGEFNMPLPDFLRRDSA